VKRGEGDLLDLRPSAWWGKAKGKKWSPDNKTRAFRHGMNAASKVFRY